MRAVCPFRSLSGARGCARIDSRLDTAKICSDGRADVDHARLRAVLGKQRTFSHGLDPKRTYVLLGRLTQADVTAFIAERLGRVVGGINTDLAMPRLRALTGRLA